jgi:undecaprenyl-diphosphatase
VKTAEAPPPPPHPASAPAWPYGLALGLLLALGLAFGLAAREAREAQPDGLDRRVLAWLMVHREAWPAATGASRTITGIGNWPWSVVATAAAGLAIALIPGREPRAWRPHEALFFAAVVATGWGLGRALKLAFRRDRPDLAFRLIDEDSFSFPSGHSVFAAVFFGMLAVLAWRLARVRSAPARLAIGLACLVLMALVAASRVWLGVHYVSDVVGGLVLGLAWVALAWTIREAWGRWRTPGPASLRRPEPGLQ